MIVTTYSNVCICVLYTLYNTIIYIGFRIDQALLLKDLTYGLTPYSRIVWNITETGMWRNSKGKKNPICLSLLL